LICSQKPPPSNRYIRKKKSRYRNTSNSNIKISRQESHLVKHTDFVPSLRTSIRMVVVMVKLWTTHPTQTRFPHVSCASWAHVPRWWHPCRTAGTRHMRGVRSRLNRLSIVNLGHSSDTTTSQSRVLVTVAPAVNRSLNQPSLSAEAGVEFCQGPTNCVALCLVDQAIASVLVFTAASSWVDTIFSLELWTQVVNIDRFHVASNCVLHLYAIARIFKSNPLNTVIVLSNN
jgi:hypothetical protein